MRDIKAAMEQKENIAAEYWLGQRPATECASMFGIAYSTARRWIAEQREEFAEWNREFETSPEYEEDRGLDPFVLPKIPPRDLTLADALRWFVRENPGFGGMDIADVMAAYVRKARRSSARKVVQTTLCVLGHQGFLRNDAGSWFFVRNPRIPKPKMLGPKRPRGLIHPPKPPRHARTQPVKAAPQSIVPIQSPPQVSPRSIQTVRVLTPEEWERRNSE